ncbi:hypothetical protein [Actinomadura nitritigenes]|uniref:hypothetical protein n=1 Tax=Actinomadura nitritigenes TaxID=134602 RepID=UPI003D8FE5B8
MNWMTFVVDLTKAGAWPLVGGIAAWRLGPRLSTAIGQFLRERQWKASGFGMAVEAGEAVTRQAEQLQESLEKAAESAGELTAEPAGDSAAEPAVESDGENSSAPERPAHRSPGPAPEHAVAIEQLVEITQTAMTLGYTAGRSGLYNEPPNLLLRWDEDGRPVVRLESPGGTYLAGVQAGLSSSPLRNLRMGRWGNG